MSDRYATTPRTTCHPCSVDRATCRARNDTAMLMSGQVHPATHYRHPTISQKGVSGAGVEESTPVVILPRFAGTGVNLSRCPGNRSTIRSMYAVRVSQTLRTDLHPYDGRHLPQLAICPRIPIVAPVLGPSTLSYRAGPQADSVGLNPHVPSPFPRSIHQVLPHYVKPYNHPSSRRVLHPVLALMHSGYDIYTSTWSLQLR